MPAPWLIPAILSGVSAGAGALASAKQGDVQRQQLAQQAKESERDYDFRLRMYNDSLGSNAYTNPMKAALLNRMASQRGVDTSSMGLPDISKYRRPEMYDPRAAEIRKEIVRQTQAQPYSGTYRDEMLRRFNAAVQSSGGRVSDNFDIGTLGRQLRAEGFMDAPRYKDDLQHFEKAAQRDGGRIDYRAAINKRMGLGG